MSPEDDVVRVAREYGLDATAALAVVRPFLASYLELVFAADSFEIITGGRGCAAELAKASGTNVAAAAFLETDRRFPGAMLGLKVAVGATTPATLYHRSRIPFDVGARHVAALCGRPVPCVDGVETLYGLGFTEERGVLRIKTYVLGAVGDALGFRSVRLGPDGVETDVREYTPDARSEAIAAHHARRALGVERFGHVASSRARDTKVYVERVGAIATDYAAR